VIDNLSRGNAEAIEAIRSAMDEMPNLPYRPFTYAEADLSEREAVLGVLRAANPPIDTVIHFAAVAFVGESVARPLQYYHNITMNTVTLLEAMEQAGITRLIYSSTCATYGNQKVPITEKTPQVPTNPYGRAKLFSEYAIKDQSLALNMAGEKFAAILLRYFNVIGADPKGRVGEQPREELRSQGRISTACFDAASGVIPHLTIFGSDFPTPDGTCVRDYIHVSDLVDAHVKALKALKDGEVKVYNVGVGKGYSVKEFINACKTVTGADITVEKKDRRPGDYAEIFADSTKVKKELSWVPAFTDLSESLATAWAFRKKGGFGSTTT